MKRHFIIFILLVGFISIITLNILHNDKEYKELPKVKLKDQNKPKQFALMLEQTKGDGDYKESNNNDLPLGGYRFNEEKSGCTDINGKKVEDVLSYDYDNYTVTLDTSKTLYCYLYYDKDNIINYLRSTDTEKHLSQDLVGDMHRYQGLSTEDVRNYICLGDYCCNTEECSADSNDDMYRIIGITENGELKVIKKTALSTVSIWWRKGDDDIKWPESLIYQALNGKSEGSTVPNLMDSNSYYYSLDNNLKKIIINNYKWLYGDYDGLGFNGDQAYAVESGKEPATYGILGINGCEKTTKKWNETIEAPIGMMYVHDYLFAYPGGNPESGLNALKSWIYLSNNELNFPTNASPQAPYEWLMTRYGCINTLNTFGPRRIDTNGYHGYTDLFAYFIIRPVFYLSSDIELSGKGTLENPFIIPNL